jgi:hypothetical protein
LPIHTFLAGKITHDNIIFYFIPQFLIISKKNSPKMLFFIDKLPRKSIYEDNMQQKATNNATSCCRNTGAAANDSNNSKKYLIFKKLSIFLSSLTTTIIGGFFLVVSLIFMLTKIDIPAARLLLLWRLEAF